MITIPLTLRLVKGSKLTFLELDQNFISLRNAINTSINSDTFVTGGTYNQSTVNLDFVGNGGFNPFSVNVQGLTDTYVSGGVYSASTGCVTFSTTSGYTFDVCGFLTGSTIWTNGSSGNYSLKTINDSGLDATGDYALAEGFNTLASGLASHAEGFQTQATDDYAHAEGNTTVASGRYSHAEGYETTASGGTSHTEGRQTTAIGNESHSEGYRTTAIGDYSHAEGNQTTASGLASHAEGYGGFGGLIASGVGSHAEGFSTTASGNYSHAEGSNTTASGSRSHAQGDATIASGDYSHAEGWGGKGSTFASGIGSHAEGFETTASGVYSHAEGKRTFATGNTSHAEGSNTTASGDYSHAEGYGGKGSTFASGTGSHAEGNQTTASGSASHAEGGVTTASGNYSHAQGYETTASGNYSHAEGILTTASGDASHAEGRQTTATGNTSHAEGRQTTASGNYSHAEGYGGKTGLIASGVGSHAEGVGTTASGYVSHAEGGLTTASGYYSHAEGKGTTASGYGSHAQGIQTIASGDNSHSEGNLTIASGLNSHAEGGETTASGNYSHTKGSNTTASGNYSSASGYYTTATGLTSHAEGNYTTASGDYSHAEGSETIASGIQSHTEGFNTTASGIASHAEGHGGKFGLTASGNYSHAEGSGTIASGTGSHAEGSNTTASGNYSHAEGSGTIASGVSSHAEGGNTIASGNWSHSEGNNTTASGPYSSASGYQTTASGPYSSASGYYTTASGNYSHAEGSNTTASGYGSHAEGSNTTASGYYSHAEGEGTTASGYGSHAGGRGFKDSRVIASGDTSFAHFRVTNELGTIGAYGDYSAILGGNDHNIGTGSTSSGIFTGSGNTISDDVLRSVVIGGQNITGTTNDTVYIPYLNINNLGAGTSINNLGIDSSGFVVVGTTGAPAFTGNTSGDCITDLYVSTVHGCSGGGQLNLRDGSDDTWSITSDNGLYASDSSWVYGQSSNGTQLGYQLTTVGEAIGFGVFASGINPLLGTANDVTIHDNVITIPNSGNLDKRAVFVGSKNSTIFSGVTNTVVIGGEGITATVSDTVYVPNLNIGTIGSGTPLFNLGVDSSGDVVTGTTDNIYNTDGTLTSNRFVDCDGKAIGFLGDSATSTILTVMDIGAAHSVIIGDSSFYGTDVLEVKGFSSFDDTVRIQDINSPTFMSFAQNNTTNFKVDFALVTGLTADRTQSFSNEDGVIPVGEGWNTIIAQAGVAEDGKVISWDDGNSEYTLVPNAGGFVHYLGEEFGGGIIYHLYKDNLNVEHGLIVSTGETTATWQNSTGTVTGGISSWDGSGNTASMTISNAANYVNALTDGGFTDWYLPSIDELKLLLVNRFNANKSLDAISATELSLQSEYWSSTERDSTSAYIVRFFAGNIADEIKTNTNSVRAVRSF